MAISMKGQAAWGQHDRWRDEARGQGRRGDSRRGEVCVCLCVCVCVSRCGEVCECVCVCVCVSLCLQTWRGVCVSRRGEVCVCVSRRGEVCVCVCVCVSVCLSPCSQGSSHVLMGRESWWLLLLQTVPVEPGPEGPGGAWQASAGF